MGFGGGRVPFLLTLPRAPPLPPPDAAAPLPPSWIPQPIGAAPSRGSQRAAMPDLPMRPASVVVAQVEGALLCGGWDLDFNQRQPSAKQQLFGDQLPTVDSKWGRTLSSRSIKSRSSDGRGMDDAASIDLCKCSGSDWSVGSWMTTQQERQWAFGLCLP